MKKQIKKIENVVDVLSNIYFMKPDGERCNEATNVFGNNKFALQMEMIEFQENTVVKHKYTDNIYLLNSLFQDKH